jgi:branched-chain amino acid transport system ATP-binding protein
VQEAGLTVLIVEQNVKQTLAVAGRAYVLENGKIVMQDTGEALLNDEHVRSAYLGV